MTHQNTENGNGSVAAFRVSISPEPTDDELVAIMHALKLLDAEESVSQEPGGTEPAWIEVARQEHLRSRTWSYQARSWALRSRSS